MLLILIGFFFHFFYSVYTEFNVQFDLGFYDAENSEGIAPGHMGYIRYLYQNFLPLQSDPREYWQYYHPPLHHYLEALLLRVQTFLGVDIEIAVYNIKYPPLLYYMLTIITMIRITKALKVKGISLIITMAIMLFSPGFLFISNYANNDMLSIFLMFHCVYLAILWYKDRNVVNILKVALCFGLGMFTKMSVWMSAVPIAIIFIAVMIEKLKAKEYKSFGRVFGQMWLFLALAAPFSFYWSIRNYVRFGVPIGYIPISYDELQHITVEPLQRVFDFDPGQLRYPYVCTKEYSDYSEYNPLIALLKTSAADIVYTVKDYNSIFYIPSMLLFAMTIILAVGGFVCMICTLFQKHGLSAVAKIAVAGSFVVLLGSYYIFCFKYPQVCTENIRYASQLIYIGALSLGVILKKARRKKGRMAKYIRKGIFACTAAFCLFSFILFALDGAFVSLFYNFL